MRGLWQDVRYGVRMLMRSRGYAVVMALTLALGIGATTAIFSMANGVLLRPLTCPQSQQRFQMLVTSTFALCALLLAGLGIYGVVSYSVTQRTREIGVRAAFGARAPELCAMVLRQGMTPVAFGLTLGVAGALACGRLLQSLLYEVKPHDPWIIALVVGVVLVTAALACYVPARRAARIDPMAALRYE